MSSRHGTRGPPTLSPAEAARCRALYKQWQYLAASMIRDILYEQPRPQDEWRVEEKDVTVTTLNKYQHPHGEMALIEGLVRKVAFKEQFAHAQIKGRAEVGPPPVYDGTIFVTFWRTFEGDHYTHRLKIRVSWLSQFGVRHVSQNGSSGPGESTNTKFESPGFGLTPRRQMAIMFGDQVYQAIQKLNLSETHSYIVNEIDKLEDHLDKYNVPYMDLLPTQADYAKEWENERRRIRKMYNNGPKPKEDGNERRPGNFKTASGSGQAGNRVG